MGHWKLEVQLRRNEHTLLRRFWRYAKTLRFWIGLIFLILAGLAVWLDFHFVDGSQWLIANSVTGKLIAHLLIGVGPELAGIVIGVVLIETLNERRHNQQIKDQLIREMASRDNGVAVRAVQELRANGWLCDGSLRGAFLRGPFWNAGANLFGAHLGGADLKEAELVGADLREANLFGGNLVGATLENANLERADLYLANLSGAVLIEASLRGANLSEAVLDGACLLESDLTGAHISGQQLATVSELCRAIMPDGKRYTGFFNLKGDIEAALALGAEPSNEAQMADFYGVSVQDYRRGQQWRNENSCDAYNPVQPVIWLAPPRISIPVATTTIEAAVQENHHKLNHTEDSETESKIQSSIVPIAVLHLLVLWILMRIKRRLSGSID